MNEGQCFLAERLNRKRARLVNLPIYNNASFPWAHEIEQAYSAIRAEFDRVLSCQSELPAFREISVGDKWRTSFLLGSGIKSEENVEACLGAWKAEQEIPGLPTAMLSIFEP